MSSPQHRASMVVVTLEESHRVRAYILRVGFVTAVHRLKIGAVTLEAARDQGRLRQSTRDRLLEALAREEAVLS